ncbi:YkvA family protein [Thalassospiraceae bacterium LMO-JJ14]|nr:YkvA family protein [Thalassospiraceae bacterium LMO-JJ14]
MSRTPEENEKIVAEGFADKARRTLGRIPFSHEAAAAYYCAIDPATPTRVRITLMAALAYFVVPVDMVPDFIALLGFTDDAAVFWAAWRSVSGHVSDKHRERARSFLGQTGKKTDDNTPA